MEIVNNFELLKSVMKFNSEDEFYFVQILIRRKDGHTDPGVNGNNKNRLIKFYTIRSIDDLSEKQEEIITIADALNARVYIHPTKRSFKEVGNECLKVGLDLFLSNVDGLKRAYSTACGKSYIGSDKKWVIDIDEKSIGIVNEMCEFIEKECEPFDRIKLQYIVPTLHGFHLITTPFNSQKFSIEYPLIDIHKNNPTLLYYKQV